MKRLAILLVLAASLLSGCVALVAGGAGAGAVTFAKGEYQIRYDKPYEETWQAAVDAFKQLGITAHNVSKGGGLMEGTRQDGTNVQLVLQSTGPSTTEAKIRVGKLGDEDYSRQLDAAIRQRLGVK